jgi:hypothetical protein
LRLVTKKLNFSSGAPELLLALELLLVSPLLELVLLPLLPEPPDPKLISLSLPHPMARKNDPQAIIDIAQRRMFMVDPFYVQA